MKNPTMTKLLQKLRERLFYRYEVELYREGMTPIYGIRATYRSKLAVLDRGFKWRAYGETFNEHKIQIPLKDLRRILEEAKTFLRDKP